MLSALGTEMSKTWTVSALLEVQPGHGGSHAHAKARVGWHLAGAGGSEEESRGSFLGNSSILAS